MQIVIDIPEDDYRKVQDGRASVTIMRNAIRNGIPLPKGHGRLIDVDKLWDSYHNLDYDFYEALDLADAIIEADKAESEDKT